jgi:hypothetical protein
MRLKHGQEEEKVYVCEAGCGRVFLRQDARLNHHRNRHPELDCPAAKSTDILNDCRQSSLLEDTAQQDELANEPNRLLPPPVSPQSSIRLEKANRRKHRLTQGDWVLIREMAPSQLEIGQK